MSDDAAIRQAEKLLGGWVAGTLTEAERALLLQASLANQMLFDAMADEEGLRELLADPVVRRDLIAVLAREQTKAAVTPEVESWWRRLFKPAPMAAFSAGVLAVVAFVVIRPAFLDRQRDKTAVALPPAEVAVEQVPAAKTEAAAADQGSTSALRARADRLAQGPVVASAPPPPPPPPPLASSPAVAPAAVGQANELAEAKKEADASKDRLAKVPEESPAKLAAPPQLGAAAPSPPPPRAVVADSVTGRLDETKSKRASMAPAAPPIRYRIERFQEQGGGQWVEYGGELGRGARARVAIEAAQAGTLTIRAGQGGAATSVPVRAGETVFYPAAGGLPSETGEREVAILFRPGNAAGALGGAASEGANLPRLFRAEPAAEQSQQQQRQQIPGGGVGQGKQQPQQQDTEALRDTRASSGDYAVTVRLRFR